MFWWYLLQIQWVYRKKIKAHKPALFTYSRTTEGETWMNVPGCRSNLLKSPAVCALHSDWPEAQLPWGYCSNRTCTPPFSPYMVSFVPVCSFWLVGRFFPPSPVTVWEVTIEICHCFPSAQIKGTGAQRNLFVLINLKIVINIVKSDGKEPRWTLDTSINNRFKDVDKVRRRRSLR